MLVLSEAAGAVLVLVRPVPEDRAFVHFVGHVFLDVPRGTASVSRCFEKAIRLTDMGAIEADEFERQRSHLFALAYRMLGSARRRPKTSCRTRGCARPQRRRSMSDRRGRVLMTVVTRLALDRLKSARARRDSTLARGRSRCSDKTAPRRRSVALAESLTSRSWCCSIRCRRGTGGCSLREVLEVLTPRSPRCSTALRPTAVSCFTARRNGSDRGSRARRARAEQKRALAERFGEVRCAPATAMSSRACSPPTSASGAMAADGSLMRGGRPRRDPSAATAARHSGLGSGAWLCEGLGQRRVRRGQLRPAMVRDGRTPVFVCSIEGDAITGIRVVRNPDKLVYLARQLGARAESVGSSVRTH